MSKIIHALTYSAIGQYSVHILNFVMIIILSRIMTPAEIGLFAIATAVYLLATELRTMGLVQYLIREKEISELKIQSALGMSVIVSWGFGGVIVVFAPTMAAFYNQPELINVLYI